MQTIKKKYIKQYLNEMSALDKLYNAITNKKNETPQSKSQHNYLNVETIMNDIKTLGTVRFCGKETCMERNKCKLKIHNSLLK